jgi:hypothetical protein
VRVTPPPTEQPAERPRVAVALCTHNGAAFVAEQVRSILAQSEQPVQLVLSDDASTDDTIAIVERELAAAPAIELIVLRNSPALGVTRNFEQAVRATSAELIALSDQDDVWHPDRVRRAVDQFVARPELTLLHSDARLIDDFGAELPGSLFGSIAFTANEQREVHDGKAFRTLLRRNVVTGATAVFRRTLLDAAVPFPTPWVHDEWLAIIASITGRVDFVPDQLIDYRQHSSNQIGARKATLSDKRAKLREPRRERNRYLVARAEALADRVRQLDADSVLADVEGKVAFEQSRRDLPASRIARIAPILAGAARGRYGRFGRGKYDVLRDLSQPDA